jgi:superoxide dismutase, Fe-Mn family
MTLGVWLNITERHVHESAHVHDDHHRHEHPPEDPPGEPHTHPHHTAHYGGALKAFAGAEAKFEESFTKGTALDPTAFERLKQIQSSRGNSVVLHELYFDGLALKASDPPEGIKAAVANRFGSVDKWAADFAASAKAASGWAMLVVHPLNGRL